jgi:recombination associated protein RdgC
MKLRYILRAGKLVTKLAVDWQERIQPWCWRMTAALKRLKFSRYVMREQNDDIDRDDFAGQRFDADFILMTSELAALNQKH